MLRLIVIPKACLHGVKYKEAYRVNYNDAAGRQDIGPGVDGSESEIVERQAMTDLERTIMREISTLPERRRADVLAFIRYLKLSIPGDQQELEERFDKALASIRARAKGMGITEEDIEAEIRAVREGK